MQLNRIEKTTIHDQLKNEANALALPESHLRFLANDTDRLEHFSIAAGGLFYDFSRQRLNASVLSLLHTAAQELDLLGRFNGMCGGDKINLTEQRAVLHTACREFGDGPILSDGQDILPEIRAVRDQMRQFCADVHSGRIAGSTGKPFRHVVVIGIGGSYLGTEFVSTALSAQADKNITLHYLSNVDIDNFGKIADAIDPETTLWVIISKSYTTAETAANAAQAEAFMKSKGIDPSRHTVTVTSKGSPGDDPANPVLQTFHMFDYIGGRFSVSSAVGGVPLGLYLGYDRYEKFLKGAAEMDAHANSAPIDQNIPLVAALISIWNTVYLGYEQQAIIPYSTQLAKLAPHIQQLSMESNGKSVGIDGQLLSSPAGMVIFGEPGTNAQHSFFQLAHQGRPFPIDFIGVLRPQYDQYTGRSKGVSNHQELWANLLAQAKALAVGQDHDRPERQFSGNRPSSTIVLESLSPENLGRLLSFFEARIVYEGFLWGVNSFDQYGVELGKTLASEMRQEMASRNNRASHTFNDSDTISKKYLEMLFQEKIEK